MTDFVQSMKFTIVENSYQFFDHWFIDLRDFTFFVKSYISGSEKHNIQVFDFDFGGTASFSKIY